MINVLGLALGIAIFLLITEYVAFEWGANRFHKNFDQLYRASTFTADADKGDYYLPPGYAPTLKNRVPGINEVVRVAEGVGSGLVIVPGTNGSTAGNKSFRENKVSFADDNFFRVFSFPVIKGSTSLAKAQTMAISASIAQKYFGNGNPIGQVLNIKNQFGLTPYTVTAVYEGMPQQSDIQADILLSYKTLENAAFRNGNNWADPNGLGSGYTNIYFMLNKGVDLKLFEAQATQVIHKAAPDAAKATLAFQPLRNLHIAPSFSYHFQTYGSLVLVVSFLSVALLIMMIAWLNYINLSTAQALYRAKESGVRKVLGASRMQIVGQYLTETAILTLISIVIAIVSVKLVQPFYNNFLGKELSLTVLNQGRFWVGGITVVFTGCFLAGGYVAFMLSSIDPLKTIRGKAAITIGGISLRRSLVVFQFTTSVILIISTITLYRQLKYMQTQDLGMNVQQRVVISGPSTLSGSQRDNTLAFENQLRQLPYVQKLAASNNVPGEGYNFSADGITRLNANVGDDKKSYAMLIVDDKYFDTYDIKIKAGATFTPQMLEQGWSKTHKIIINESAAAQLGFKNTENIIGQKIKWDAEFEVVGVVKDYHHLSLHEFIRPMIFLPAVAHNYFTIKMDTRNLAGHVSQLKSIYEHSFPGEPFTYTFADESFDKQYNAEQKLGNVFMASAGAAVFIAALGLFGLATFAARQKIKEIGIRKVLGANVLNIVTLISADFLKLVAIAIVIASPVAWYIMNKWLQDFAYHTSIQWWVFALAGSIAVVIAFVTVSIQSVKAAIANPVKSLRNE
ncbi:hypothetical protein RG47T_1409 [Mucilaginibacter polytrichastri]|uniref:ABC3 transporter permease protein domain-containing protein n=1 Tax=Mucilaginibacter polytrichastri TaxID=1302689 RepID=A0A1Q5ZW11_9SPHI|nr:hypothetical protein RG47T_1409 [Mucilaginibacter polytrichastri]